MKRSFIGLLALAVLLAALPMGGAQADAGASVISCPQQGFSTLCDANYSWEWNDDTGIAIYPESYGKIPYVLIYWTRDGGSSNPEGYFADELTPQMKAEYGDRLIEIGEYHMYTVADVEMPGQAYVYLVQDVPVVMLRLFDLRWGGNVGYTVKHIQGDSDAALGALARAVAYFQPDANYYANGGQTEPGAQPPSGGQTEPGTQPSAGGADAGGLQGYTVTPSRPIVTGTANYSDGRFSIDLPLGWQILTTGEYADFSFRAWDPDAPDRCIVFFNKMQPFLKSQAAKSWYQQMGPLGGDYYVMLGNCPVMEELTLPCFLQQLGDVKALCQKYHASGAALDPAVVPVFYDLQILETMPSGIPAAPSCGDNRFARIAFTSERGAACEGLVTAQPTWTGDYNYDTGGVDVWPYTVYNFMSVTAPVGEMAELEPILTQCLNSFTYTDSYLRAAQQAAAEETSALLSMSQSMQAAYDAYNSAWSQRQTSYDVQSQKYSDATLGYERLYDPDTQEVYRAETGFYDSYDLHRGEYAHSNLQRVDDSTADYYLRGVDYYITH